MQNFYCIHILLVILGYLFLLEAILHVDTPDDDENHCDRGKGCTPPRQSTKTDQPRKAHQSGYSEKSELLLICIHHNVDVEWQYRNQVTNTHRLSQELPLSLRAQCIAHRECCEKFDSEEKCEECLENEPNLFLSVRDLVFLTIDNLWRDKRF